MRYCIQKIVENIENQIKDSATNKLLIKIDSFETPEIYLELWKQIKKVTIKYNFELIYKLCDEKYEDFKRAGKYDFFLREMQDNGLLAEGNKLTSYRNEIPENKSLIILLGTEVSEESGSLADFFTINIQTIEDEMKNKYCEIFQKFNFQSEDIDKCINNLYKEVFRYVPKNIYRLSCLVDKLEGPYDDADDLFYDIFTNLYEDWGLVNIYEKRPSFNELKGGKQFKILQLADKFLKRKDFDKMSVINKNEAKIDSFIQERLNDGIQWPINYEIKSYDEFKECLMNYMQGINVESNRKKLSKIDFSYICDALNMKMKSKEETNKKSSIKFSDEPIITFSKSIIKFYEILFGKDIYDEDKLLFEIKQAGIAQAITEEDVYDVWKNICLVTGGIFEFFNRESISILEERQLEIDADDNYFDFTKSMELYDNGILKKLPATQSLCKIIFTLKGQNCGFEQEFIWEFDPKEDWLVLFQDITPFTNNISEKSAMIPFGINDKLSTVLDVRNKSEFYGNYENLCIDYRYDLLDEFNKLYIQNYPDYYAKFFRLGQTFSTWVREVIAKGLFATIYTSAYEFIQSYISYAEYLLDQKPTAEFEQSYKLYINSFIISDTANPILQDVDINCAVIPPYHPAVLEKLLYRIDYIKWGLHKVMQSFISGSGSNQVSTKESFDKIDRLVQLSVIDSAVDVLIGENKCITKTSMYGYYTVYSVKKEKPAATNVLSDMMQRDGIFSEDFNPNEYKKITPLAKIIKNNIKNYINVFAISYSTLAVVAINFDDLQDVVSAIHNLIDNDKSGIKLSAVNLTILMPIEKQGGQNYLAHWINNFFDEDSDVKIKIYLNYYKSNSDISAMIPITTDVVFFNDVLNEVDVKFSSDELERQDSLTDTKFPMVYRTLPISITSKKRQIEITQTQFLASTLHAQVVYKLQHMSSYNNKMHLVIKEMEMGNQTGKLLEQLHEKAKWVVCIGLGLDKKLLMSDNETSYKIIGFTTGEGTYGEYNVTTSACLNMIEDLKAKLTMKFNRIFSGLGGIVTQDAVDYCINQLCKLDGISILKALNPEDYDINNFLAYLMTNQYFINQAEIDFLVPLDSYRHWFEANSNNSKNDTKSRPDFLQLTIKEIDESKPIKIYANVIECKFAKENGQHFDKALGQVINGLEALKLIFDPAQSSIEKRYWFAQLYKVLTFSQINILDNDQKFSTISKKLMKILDGEFEIQWSGTVMTYWIDSDIDTISVQELYDELDLIHHITFGQKQIIQYLTGNHDLHISYDADIKLDFVDEFELEEIENKEAFVITNEEKIDTVISQDSSIDISPIYLYTTNNSYNSQETKKQDNTFLFVAATNETVDFDVVRDGEADSMSSGGNNEVQIDTISRTTVCLGKSFPQNEQIRWDFKDPKMSNRHVLITGKSGQGKTYAIQGMFMELAVQNIPVVIFDYTGGFVEDKLEPTVLKRLEGKINQQIVRLDRLKINPFKIQTMNIGGRPMPEQSVDVAERLKDILVHVYNFGDQQGAAIYRACKNGLDKYGDKMNFSYFKDELEELGANGTKEAKSVYNKIISFLDYDIFDTENDSNWADILYKEGEVTVFQLSYVQSKDMQIAITEMILWDMWYYTVKNGSEDKPFAVILDEAQNLSFGDKAPTTKILTEGRKFGWSGWFATQFLKGQLKAEEVNRLQQAALRVYFKPADDEIQSMAVSIDPEKKDIGRWIKQLTRQQKGECVVSGDGLYGSFSQKIVPVIIKVPSIEERE